MGLSRPLGEAVVALVFGGVVSLVALAATVVTVRDALGDVRALRRLGIGNGRMAAAWGDYILGVVRTGQALAMMVLVGLLLHIALASGLAHITFEWVVVVSLVVMLNASVAFMALYANRVRRNIYRLGLDDHTSTDTREWGGGSETR
jgi:hypothetical protein